MVSELRESRVQEQGDDVTLDILQSLDWMRVDLNWRRAQTGLDADVLSPQMQTVTQLVEDLRAGTIQCRRLQTGRAGPFPIKGAAYERDCQIQ